MSPAVIAALTLVTVALLVTLLVVSIGRRRRRPANRLRAAAHDLLADVLIPDVDGGQIQLQYLLLCDHGIVVLDIKQARGNVFGGDSMDEWTVMTGQQRYTFRNPQPALYDRLAAVKTLVEDAPVSGHVAFLPGADFTKGVPADVVLFDEFLASLTAGDGTNELPAAYTEAWLALKQAATPLPA